MPSRRARRRLERQRLKRARPVRRLPLAARLALAIGGVAAILAGVVLLTSGSPGSATRLARLAGILILLGLAGIGIAILGRT